MTLLGAMLVGAGFGLGLFLASRALRPRPAPLARVLVALERPGSSVADLATGTSRGHGALADRLGTATLGFLDATGLADTGQLRRRLRILDKPAERHAFEKLFGGIEHPHSQARPD